MGGEPDEEVEVKEEEEEEEEAAAAAEALGAEESWASSTLNTCFSCFLCRERGDKSVSNSRSSRETLLVAGEPGTVPPSPSSAGGTLKDPVIKKTFARKLTIRI